MIQNSLLKKYKNFSHLYYAGLTSELGSFVSETAINLYVFTLAGHQKSILGISRAVFLFCLTIGAILGGPLGERYNRKKILLYSSYLRIPLVILLFFFQELSLIIILTGLIAFFTGLYNPSRQAMMNELIPSGDIKSANALFGSTMAILHMAGPFIGAMVFAYTQGINEIIFFDFFTYILGAYLLTKIKYKNEPAYDFLNDSAHKSKNNLMSDLRKGLEFVNSRSDLRAILKNTLFNGICIGILIPLLLPFSSEVLQQDQKSYAVLLASFGLGGMFGAVAAKYLSRFYNDGKIIIFAVITEPLVMLLWLNTMNLFFNVLVFFFWGIIVFTRITAQLNHVSETVETKYLTRIHSLLDLAFIVPNISSGILIAIIGNQFTTLQILNYTSIAYLFTILYAIFGTDSKRLNKYIAKQVSRKIYD